MLVGALSALRAEDYSITTFAGAANVVTGADGTPGSFNNPYAVAIDSAKNLYVTDTLNNTIRKITPARVVSTLAGTAGQFGSTDGTGSAARFNFPVGVAVDGAGNVYVADAKNFTIRKITAAGVVSTFAGAVFQPGAVDGAATSARFFLPYGVAVDSAGNVYVADGGNHTIRKITPEGVVSTLAGTAQQSGFVNGTGSAARFNTPFAVAVDSAGNVYVADSENHAIRRVTPAGVVSTVAGAGVSGQSDGATAVARFNQPRGVAVDAAGNVYVVDSGNSTLRQITPAGVVSTLAGAPGVVGEVDSVGAAARLYSPTGIATDNTTIYFADTNNNLVRRGVPASAAALPNIVIQPLDQEVAVGQSVTFGVNASNANGYQWLKNSVVIDGATTASYTIGSAQLSDVASYSVRVSGAGGAVDSATGNLSVTPVSSGPISITARPLSQSVAVGQSVTFSVTASGNALTYQWLRNGATITGATNPTFTIPAAQTGDAGTYAVRIASGTTTETPTARLIVGGSQGDGSTVRITTQPTAGSVELGGRVTMSVVATGANLTYQWFKDGSAIAGATSASYTINSAQTTNAGRYFVRVSSGTISADSNVTTLSVISDNPGPGPGPGGPTSRLANLSVRTSLAAGQDVIVGTTVSGGSSELLVRAAGPALAPFVGNAAMADPRLELFRGSTLVFENNDWPANLADTFTRVAAFPFAPGSRDAAFVRSIESSVTIPVRGTGPGVVLVEAYDLGTGNPARLVNVSARNQVGTGDNILIAGFNISGTGEKKLLIRAVGPKLQAFGISGFLADPKLEVFRSTGNDSVKIAENDNWAASLADTFTAVSAFALDTNSRDAALVTSLPPGSYTVQVSGVGGGTGEALIEIYEAP
jgi:sugar lactone lactonase YvrE